MESRQRIPQDLVAIFHASFHPTKGNIIDWSLKASDELDLNSLEYNALPSGLHLVERDVIYFTKDNQHGVCVFRRRKTTEKGHRGVRLSSLGILLARSARPRPWRHLAALQVLLDTIYSSLESSEDLQPKGDDWEPARLFYEERKVRRADLAGAGDWQGWGHELDVQISGDNTFQDPSLHLPHLLRILGPSSLTLHKFVLGRKRVLIYTQPPVEAACILCHVAADMCYEDQLEVVEAGSLTSATRLKGRCKDVINVLGMVTLSDLDRMESEGASGRGWIACTTDALFMERPAYYDLLIDLTNSVPVKSSRPTFYVSTPNPAQTKPTHRLTTSRFSWSDVKLWNELDRVISLDPSCSDFCCSPLHQSPDALPLDPKYKMIAAWTDVWRVYEDVCVICAGLWMGSWRGNGSAGIRLEGDDDFAGTSSVPTTALGHVRSLGQGIEGRPVTSRALRRSSGMSWSSGRATVNNAGSTSESSRRASRPSTSSPETSGQVETSIDPQVEEERRDAQLLTTLSLLQTLHAHTLFQLSALESILPPPSERANGSITVAPREILAFELGPFSALDAKYLEWLVQEYGGGTRVALRRSWKDLIGVFFGY